MSDSTRHGKVSVFAHAVRSSDIHRVIDSKDLRQMRPGWSEAQANAFLRDHAEQIAGEMLTAGMAMLVLLLNGGDRGN